MLESAGIRERRLLCLYAEPNDSLRQRTARRSPGQNQTHQMLPSAPSQKVGDKKNRVKIGARSENRGQKQEARSR